MERKINQLRKIKKDVLIGIFIGNEIVFDNQNRMVKNLGNLVETALKQQKSKVEIINKNKSEVIK